MYYLDEEEVDFEKLINAPLPRVPREVTLTAHWTAIEGVQPMIPQNPSQVEIGRQGVDPSKGSTAANSLAAVAGMQDKVAVKPLVKHILSKELQLYFEKVCGAVLDEGNDTLRNAALASLRHDNGLHQLLPYFVQFVGEKITHNLRNIGVLSAMMDLVFALLENPDIFIDPYVSGQAMHQLIGITPLTLILDPQPGPLCPYLSDRAPSWRWFPGTLSPPRPVRLDPRAHHQALWQFVPHP